MSERIFGFDFNISDVVSGFKVVGTENQSSLLDTGAVLGTRYLLNGINAELAKQLRKGEAFLEFWIEAIDHTKPTANRKLYPAEVFKAGLECKSFQNQLLNGGGVPGEAEHPMIKMYDENPNSQKNIYNNLARVNYIDPNNVSHYIVGYKCTPEKTYFKIRTNPENPKIVYSILAGRQPGFSIRTRGDFEEENGVIVAKGLEVITIDYVSNPANVTSVARPEIKAINPAEAKEVELTLLPKTGTESIGLNNFLKEGDKLIYDSNSIGIESICNMRIISADTKPTESFEKAFEMAWRTF